jgi:polysaccharide export outer membrane protein
MKYPNFYFYIIFLIFTAFFSSCGSKRDIVYFQAWEKIPAELYQQDKANNKIVIMPNDNLFITVSASNLEAVNVFNTINLNRGSLTTSSLDLLGYLVDQKGYINFPLVGKLHVAGLTKTEAVELLQKEVAAYVENVVINIRFLNYKISVLGEVNRPGVYTVTDEKLSIPQAVALAGDLTIYGERRNIQLIRVENGEKQSYLIDLTSPELFFSPLYYLQQNDILYISPNGTRAGSSTYNQNLPLLVSLISITITAIALFVRK